MGGVRPNPQAQNSPGANPCDFNTRNPLNQDSSAFCRRSRSDFFTHHPRHHHHHPMRKQNGVAWMQGKLARHRRAAQASAFSIPPAPPPQTQPPAIVQQAKTMTESIALTTSAAKISALVATGGKYVTSLASRLIDNVTENSIDELSWTIGGVTHTMLGTMVTPFRGSFSTVKPVNRFAVVSSQPGNEAHVQRLAAAVRTAMGDRDVVTADAAIRGLGGEGFSVEVAGV